MITLSEAHGRDLLPKNDKRLLTVPWLCLPATPGRPDIKEIGGVPVIVVKPYVGSENEHLNSAVVTTGTWRII